MSGLISGRVLVKVEDTTCAQRGFSIKKCLIELFGLKELTVIMRPLVSINSIISYFSQLFYPAVYQQPVQV